MTEAPSFTAFLGARRLAAGRLEVVAHAVAAEGAPQGTVLVLDDATGRAVDLDLRQGPAHAAADYLARITSPPEPPPRQGRGRPRLGVVAREVTLLPRHWDWLASQPGGASAALRRLVDDARRATGGVDAARAARDSLYRAMAALAGDAPGFETAARALFSADDEAFEVTIAAWPPDIAAYLRRLAHAERAARHA